MASGLVSASPRVSRARRWATRQRNGSLELSDLGRTQPGLFGQTIRRRLEQTAQTVESGQQSPGQIQR